MTAPEFRYPFRLRDAFQDTRNNTELEIFLNAFAVLKDEDGYIDMDGVTGYLFGGTVEYTTSGTFSKDVLYRNLRAVKVKVQGGGGGGGSAATTGAGQMSIGGGGAGGGYAEAFILASDLAASEAVTVGAAGTGGTTGAGGAGGDSVFDTISGEVRGAGGGGGPRIAAATNGVSASTGGAGSGGDLNIDGQSVRCKFLVGQTLMGMDGGVSHLGKRVGVSGASNVGIAGGGASGNSYGAGGGGGFNSASQGSTRNGGAGSQGIVIVELYY